VSHWFALAPAFVIACLVRVYFGFTVVTLAVDTLSGTWQCQSLGNLIGSNMGACNERDAS
jgi:hypothetical protein